MAHIRKSIRDNVVTTLTGLATTGANVYRTRFYPIAEGKTPGLAIYTQSETVESATITRPRTKMRELEVVVEGYAIGISNLDNTLDQISLEVEEAMVTDVTRGGLAKDTELSSVEADYSGDAERPAGTIKMIFLVTYASLENDAETAV